MNDYISLRLEITPCSEAITDVCAALLADEDFESFVPDASGLTAYISAPLYTPEIIERLKENLPFEDVTVEASTQLIAGRDWNSEWEKNYFKPIVVGGECVIHSSFHTDFPTCRYDIVIDPKMAFGTGHHATTSSIITTMLELDLTGKKMVDMGTGTGILAILAAMMGCKDITAIEIDEAAYTNACENIRINNHEEINLIHGDALALKGISGINFFVANINRNIILADMEAYTATLAPGAIVLFSGFYKSDIPVIEQKASTLGLTVDSYKEIDNWVCVKLIYNN